jgi:hypothetical protein
MFYAALLVMLIYFWFFGSIIRSEDFWIPTMLVNAVSFGGHARYRAVTRVLNGEIVKADGHLNHHNTIGGPYHPLKIHQTD